jgi:flagellin-specific chaperone FliS
VAILYESGVGQTWKAKEAIKDPEVIGANVIFACSKNIVNCLLGTLSIDAGGDPAKRLSSLHEFFIEKIMAADTAKNMGELYEILPLIFRIKDTWAGIVNNDEAARYQTQDKPEISQFVSLEV